MTYQEKTKLTSLMQSLQSNNMLKKINAYIKSRERGISKAKCLKNFNQHEFTQAFDNKYLFELLDEVSKLEAGVIIKSMMATLYDINSLYSQLMDEICEKLIDEAKSSKESAKELWKQALKMIREIEERRSQNVEALIRTS